MSISRREAMIGLLERLPTAAVSRAVGHLARMSVPRRLREPLWQAVAGRLGMSLGEAAEPASSYRSFDALFTRRLSDEARPIEWAPGALVAPADGKLTWNLAGGSGPIGVKGTRDVLARWLGREALPWNEPWVAVIYLSPRDYHRVHSPLPGKVVGVTYTPGGLVPVNPRLAGDGARVFGSNERVTCWLESAHGPVAVAMIGATCVGGIQLSFTDLAANRGWRRRGKEWRPTAPLGLEAGEEIGTFHMGSSVVLVWERRGFVPSPALTRGRSVQMGQRLGAWE